MSIYNLCFRAKIRKNVYPCTPQFYYTKVGCKGVFVTRTCFRDVPYLDLSPTNSVSDDIKLYVNEKYIRVLCSWLVPPRQVDRVGSSNLNLFLSCLVTNL